MEELEKVIKALEYCEKGCNSDCPYWEHFGFDDGGCLSTMNKDALKLLQEQNEKIKIARRWLNASGVDLDCISKILDLTMVDVFQP